MLTLKDSGTISSDKCSDMIAFLTSVIQRKFGAGLSYTLETLEMNRTRITYTVTCDTQVMANEVLTAVRDGFQIYTFDDSADPNPAPF